MPVWCSLHLSQKQFQSDLEGDLMTLNYLLFTIVTGFRNIPGLHVWYLCHFWLFLSICNNWNLVFHLWLCPFICFSETLGQIFDWSTKFVFATCGLHLVQRSLLMCLSLLAGQLQTLLPLLKSPTRKTSSKENLKSGSLANQIESKSRSTS